MLSRAVRLTGTEQLEPTLRRLRAGPLSVDFDNGAIRYVLLDNVEVLRGISFLVRDENWGTFAPSIENLAIDEGDGGFCITYRATCADARRSLVYDARITGRSDGSLSFVAEAEPLTDVLTNRTGFIVLHPIRDLAGQPVKVRHSDGSEFAAHFPALIDPRVPFTDIRALSHEAVPGVWATCSMEGEDAFEMEDQRNWSDASYKTYVRSLKQPWPYTLEKGRRFSQGVHLSVTASVAPASTGAGSQADTVLSLGRRIGMMPRIGVGVPAEEAAHALASPDLTRRLAPRWLVCEVDLRRGHGRRELDAYAALASLIGAGVVLEIITRGTLDPHAELEPVAAAVKAAGLRLEAVTVFPAQDMVSVQPDAPWPEMPSFAETYSAARRAFPGVNLGGGMAAYFTELNRKRPPAAALDYVTFTTCPNVHAADDISVMETLEALPQQIRSARAFIGDRPLRIGPSQLGCRENPYGKATAPNPDNRRACLSRIDPRQRGLFNAAWTLGYVAAAAREAVDAVALGAPTGAFGHFYRRADFIQPWFDEQDGALVYPSYHVMAGLAHLSGAELLEVHLSMGQGIDAIAARQGGRTTTWLANLMSETRTVTTQGLTAKSRISQLSGATFELSARNWDFLDSHATALSTGQIEMDAYSVVRIETDE